MVSGVFFFEAGEAISLDLELPPRLGPGNLRIESYNVKGTVPREVDLFDINKGPNRQ